LSRITPDGALTATVLGVQLWLIWRTYQLSREAEARSQRHDRISVRPALEFYTYGDIGSVRIVCSNYGIGPAKIREQIFTIDGRPSRPGESPGPIDLLRELLHGVGLRQEALEMLRELAPHTWMGAGEEWECVRIELPGYSREQTFTLRDRIQIKINYESLYGDPFEVENGFMRPQRQSPD
jgi:hypothetical protein